MASLPGPGGLRVKVFGALIGVVVVVNIWGGVVSDQSTEDRWAGLRMMASDDFLELALDDQAVHSLYGASADIGLLSPGALVVVSAFEGEAVDRTTHRLLGFGRASDVRVLAEQLPSLPGDFDLEPFIVARGEGGRRGEPYVVALDPGVDPSERILVRVQWDRPVSDHLSQVAYVDGEILGIGPEDLSTWP